MSKKEKKHQNDEEWKERDKEIGGLMNAQVMSTMKPQNGNFGKASNPDELMLLLQQKQQQKGNSDDKVVGIDRENLKALQEQNNPKPNIPKPAELPKGDGPIVPQDVQIIPNIQPNIQPNINGIPVPGEISPIQGNIPQPANLGGNGITPNVANANVTTPNRHEAIRPNKKQPRTNPNYDMMNMSIGKSKTAQTAPPVLKAPIPKPVNLEPVKETAAVQYCHDADMNYPKRRQMEDAHVELDPLYTYIDPKHRRKHVVALYGIFDGHGGRHAALKTADIIGEICETRMKGKGFDSTEVFIENEECKKLQETIDATPSVEKKAQLNEQLKQKHEILAQKIHQLNEVFTEAMKDVMIAVDDVILGERVDESGCCALLCFIDKCGSDKIVCMANVGDSCGYVFEQDPKTADLSGVIEMSVEHRANRMNQEEMDRILDLGGLIYNDRVNGTLAVTRALGDSNLKPFVSNEPFCRTMICNEEKHKLIVLGCDGLWDYVPSSSALLCLDEYIRDYVDFKDYAKNLVRQSIQNRSTDNISAIVIELFKILPKPQ